MISSTHTPAGNHRFIGVIYPPRGARWAPLRNQGGETMLLPHLRGRRGGGWGELLWSGTARLIRRVAGRLGNGLFAGQGDRLRHSTRPATDTHIAG